MRYDDHREDTVTAALTATLHGVKDRRSRRHHPRFLPRGLTLAASSNGMALPRMACRLRLANAENVFGEIITDACEYFVHAAAGS